MLEVTYNLMLDGKPWSNWTEVSLGRSIERMGGFFSATMAGKADAPLPSYILAPGMTAQFEIDGQVVLDGYIDDVHRAYDASASDIALGGRDKTGDLIDCAATVDGPFEFYNQTLAQVVARVVKPYGIPLRVDTDTGAPFSRLSIQPGETAHAFIERVCRYRAVLAVADGVGGLVLTKPGTEKSPGRLVYGQNILRASSRMDGRGRFSLYVVKGQAEGRDGGSAEDISSNEARAVDDLVRRYRPTVITAESQGNNQTLRQRAGFARNVARARANTATFVVPGWHAAPGEVWRPNTLVPVSDPDRGIEREMLVTSLTFERNAGGTTTMLEMAIPEAYEIMAEVEPKASTSKPGWENYDIMALK